MKINLFFFLHFYLDIKKVLLSLYRQTIKHKHYESKNKNNERTNVKNGTCY